MKNTGRLFLTAIVTLATACSWPVDYSSLVDTRMGTDSCNELSQGNTYPGTGRPFGMHLWTPQTERDRSMWKYQWRRETICGFNLTHACSPWAHDYACIALFPQTGEEPLLSSSGRGAAFSHDNEVARPESYKVTFDNGISTEMAPTDKCCAFRFRFPDNGQAAVIMIDLWNNAGEIVRDGDMVRGKVCDRQMENSFVIEFSCPFLDFHEWTEGRERGAYVTFPAGSEVEVRLGTSYLGYDQAMTNLRREIGDRKYADVRREGQKVWNETLGRIEVRGDKEDMRTFYTCLYRSCLNSRMFYELDDEGEPVYFSPHDGTVHEGYMYSDNGFWDTYRALFPLHNILFPEQQGRYMKAIMDIYDQLGWLPSWYLPKEEGGMTGNHAISLLADAWVKGIRTVDPAKVLSAYAHDITATPKPRGYSDGRFQEYWQLGYVPYPEHYGSTTMTVEYAYDDWCALTFAREAGDREWTDRLEASSQYYRNVFDGNVNFMRGRDRDGGWIPDFRPGAWGGPFVEGDAWQQSFSAVHDIPGMMEMYGGKQAFSERLDSLFLAPALIDLGFYDDIWNEMVEMVMAGTGQYNHGNQPCHHIAYLYDYCGYPWKTQKHVRDIMARLYHCAPRGYPGDEDQGATSAWFVLSALGLYDVCPGNTQYAIGSPIFRKAVVHLENGKDFKVIARGNSSRNVYVRSMTLDGRPLDEPFLDHSDITGGGVLRMEMSPDHE